MKVLFKCLLSLFLCLIVTNIYGQEIIEIKKPENSKIFLESFEKIQADPDNFSETIKVNESMLDKDIKPFEECMPYGDLIYLYGFKKNYKKALSFWNEALEKQCFFSFTIGVDTDPPFLKEIEDQKKVEALYKKNEQLKQAAQLKSKVEYYVNTPINYLKEKKYPLIIVLHGGWGTHWSSELLWTSDKIKNEYIAAYIQGSIVRTSFLRSFNEESGLKSIQSVYEQIIKNYSVDKSRIVIAGPSAGGKRSLLLTLDKLIPSKGLILAFPVKPQELDAGKVIDMAIRGVRVNIIGGENDWGLKGQKEMGVIFDKLGVENRFVIFPKVGHNYPPGFSEQIDLSLEYIFKIEKIEKYRDRDAHR